MCCGVTTEQAQGLGPNEGLLGWAQVVLESSEVVNCCTRTTKLFVSGLLEAIGNKSQIINISRPAKAQRSGLGSTGPEF